MPNVEKGDAWWQMLSPLQKEAEVEPRLDKSDTCEQIRQKLGLSRLNMVMTVRTRIKAKRKAAGISTSAWNKQGPKYSRPPRIKPGDGVRAQEPTASFIYDDKPASQEELAPHLYRAPPYRPGSEKM
jgi:hypothetical protein